MKHKLRLALILAVIALILYDGNTRLVTDRFCVEIENLPDGFDGYRIVQLSDLHTTRFGEENSKLFELVADEVPDIIVVTGDIIDGSDDNEQMAREREYVSELVDRLTEIAPVYCVTGNHEWISPWKNELFTVIEDHGAELLRNEYVILTKNGSKLVLAGVDDPNGPYDMKTPDELTAEIRLNEGMGPIILLCHRNDRLSTWAELGIDAVFCGHAHGGLIRLPFTDGLVAPGMNFMPKYTSGIYEDGNTKMIVSRGTGNYGKTLRLFNNPEIVSVTLKKATD